MRAGEIGQRHEEVIPLRKDGEETQVEDNIKTEGHGRKDTIPQLLSGLTFTLSSPMMEVLRTIEVLKDSPEVDLITRGDTNSLQECHSLTRTEKKKVEGFKSGTYENGKDMMKGENKLLS